MTRADIIREIDQLEERNEVLTEWIQMNHSEMPDARAQDELDLARAIRGDLGPNGIRNAGLRARRLELASADYATERAANRERIRELRSGLGAGAAPLDGMGVCSCCGQMFVESTRRRPARGRIWQGVLAGHAHQGVCPRCHNDYGVLGGAERAWTEDEKRAALLSESRALELHRFRRVVDAHGKKRAAAEKKRRLDEAAKREQQRKAREAQVEKEKRAESERLERERRAQAKAKAEARRRQAREAEEERERIARHRIELAETGEVEARGNRRAMIVAAMVLLSAIGGVAYLVLAQPSAKDLRTEFNDALAKCRSGDVQGCTSAARLAERMAETSDYAEEWRDRARVLIEHAKRLESGR